MATLSPALALRPCFLNGAVEESSKLEASAHCNCKNTIKGFVKSDNKRNFFWGEVARNSKGTSCQNSRFKVSAISRVSTEKTEQIATTVTGVVEREKASSYLFRADVGGQVKVVVSKRSERYAVYVEVSFLDMGSSYNGLVLSWGIYRSDSSCFIPLEFQTSAAHAGTVSSETPFIQMSPGRFVVELEFEAREIPFYLSFLLKNSSDVSPDYSQIRSHRRTNFCVPVGFGSGQPFPLGLSFSNDGSANFAVFSRNSKSVVLCLYDDSKTDKPALEIDLDPYVNRSGDIWHASLESASNFVSYGYRCKRTLQQKSNETVVGHVLLDPYAKIIVNSLLNNSRPRLPLGGLCREPDFNWDGDVHPNLPTERLVVYRLNVNRFTAHKSSQLPTGKAGTFSGLVDKVHHFRRLGVNAVLLEPVFPFDEKKGPYFPYHFFSPTSLYGHSEPAINSMKEMVKNFHANGIEVLLEVVFTHTADSGALQGIDDMLYYYYNRVKELGARNALNSNYPIVQQLILDSLRYWVSEFHIDGFCFMSASYLLRGYHGESLSRPPLVEAIAFDPLLSKTKIIADCWDPHDLVLRETRFPHWKRWAEMNSKFCTDVRNYLRGKGLLSDLATRFCGSGDIFSDGRGPTFSFNYITRNFGLPLVDLVSFSNGELASEFSWNCGEEGPTRKTTVLERRLKQIRNSLFILYVSLGIPVLNMGDECGQSSGGSLAYCDRKAFDWTALGSGFGMQTTQFISFLSSFRMRRSDLLQRKGFLKEDNIKWCGSDQSSPRWHDPSCKFLAVTLVSDKLDIQSGGNLFIAFNATDHSENIILPLPPEGMEWRRLVDTALPFPGFFSTDGEMVPKQMEGLFTYKMKSHSCALFEASGSSS